MTLEEITETGIDPAMALLPSKMDSAEARVMLLAIGFQESRMQQRRQLVGNPPTPTGPAKGLWQFERGGGVVGVMTHPATMPHARALCEARGVQWMAAQVWDALQHDDVLAAGLARLLLWSDAGPLPCVTDEAAGWALYLRTWRPGKPHPQTWPGYHRQARRFLGVP